MFPPVSSSEGASDFGASFFELDALVALLMGAASSFSARSLRCW